MMASREVFPIRRSTFSDFLSIVICCCLCLLWVATPLAAASKSRGVKPDSAYLWLEEVHGKKAIQWVKQQTQKTLKTLQSNPNYEKLKRDALDILQAKDKIPYGSFYGEYVYNFWQDATHIQGIWRRATWTSYQSGKPEWDTLIDMDALSKESGKTLVFKGAECVRPRYERCLIKLSNGGSDASAYREFDVSTRRFVDDGFTLEPSKSSLTWLDPDHVFFGDALRPETQTRSGYPMEIRLWTRGTPVEKAVKVFAGTREDVRVNSWVIHDEQSDHVFFDRRISFFSIEISVYQGGRVIPLPLPKDIVFEDLFQGQLLLLNRKPLAAFEPGSILSLPLDKLMAGKAEYTRVMTPGPRQAIHGISRGQDFVYVELLDEVRGKLMRFRLDRIGAQSKWIGEFVPLEDAGSVATVSVDDDTNRLLLEHSSPIAPSVLIGLNGKTMEMKRIMQLSARFNAAGLIVSQKVASSPDGTQIPYFLIHRADLQLDGKNPTLLYGYGGFEIPIVPTYMSIAGKLWLERGGVFVIANIRGGGEFGPTWHQAALKKNREKAYDDFAAVARTLIESKITSPRHLGIMGASNGGLLVGASFVRNPEMFNAVVCDVPLLDMMRYHKLLAGASWMDEYGDPDDPEIASVIRRYSPFQNLSPTKNYPEVFFQTSTFDDRVHPGHARKMAARMADMGHLFYYYENTEGGHSDGANQLQAAQMHALEYSYLWMKLGSKTP